MALRQLHLTLVAVLFFLAIIHSPPIATAVTLPPQLTVYSEEFHTSNIINPYLSPGQTLNFSIEASNLPPILDSGSGGISGFEIAIQYNSSILKTLGTNFSGPQCHHSDRCIFDMPVTDTFVSDNSLNSPAGTTSLGVVSLGPAHRPDLSFLQGLPAVLFQIQFGVIGKGQTSISIQPAGSQILGYSQGCGSLLGFTLANGSFDNRDPFIITTSQSSGTISPGSTLTFPVNVSRVNSFGSGAVTLLLSGITTNTVNGTFSPRTSNLNDAQPSFRSALTITTTPKTPPGNYPLAIEGVIPQPAPNYFQYNLNFLLIVTSSPTTPYTATPTVPSNVLAPVKALVPTGPLPPALLASFNFSSSNTPNDPITFTALAVWCSSPPYNLHWDFGDGSTGTGNPATHSYTKTGRFTVTLTVTNNGNSYNSTREITITPPPSPAANLDVYATLAIGLTAATLAVLFLVAILKPRRRRNSRR